LSVHQHRHVTEDRYAGRVLNADAAVEGQGLVRDGRPETSVPRAELTDLSGRSSVPSCHHRGPEKGVRFAVTPTLILRERWRASRLPSVPSALRGLDPRQPLRSTALIGASAESSYFNNRG